jgi:hypothetical protein
MKKAVLAAVVLSATAVHATPTTTVWAPSNTFIQPFLTPHFSYDTYFWRRGSAGSTSSPIYPVTTGLTMGVLPLDMLQAEVGLDLLLPGNDPLLFNAKLGVPEDKLFAWQPSLAVGIFGVGTKTSSDTELGTDYNILYAQMQHSIPVVGGFVSVGGYYSLQEKLFHSSAGDVQRAGFMGGVGSPDINVGLPWLQKIVLAADVQTGKNVFGAAAAAASFYFTDKIAVLTGPVYFFDRAQQPGASEFMWTVQLDIDMPLRSSPAPAQAGPISSSDPAPSAAPAQAPATAAAASK